MVLNTESLMELNAWMLGEGAPTSYDGKGYNKFHYGPMMEIHWIYRAGNKVTDKQFRLVAETLMKYAGTQLLSHRKDLEETIKYLDEGKSLPSRTPSKKLSGNEINIDAHDEEGVTISFGYCKEMSDYIRSSDRANYRWKKDPGGAWHLFLRWSGIEPYLKVFENNNFDTSEIVRLKNETAEKLKNMKYKVEVIRPDDSTHTLTLTFKYNENITNALKGISVYDYKTKTYQVRICDTPEVYERLKNCGTEVDLSELEPYAAERNKWRAPEISREKVNEIIDSFHWVHTPYDFQKEDIYNLVNGKGDTKKGVALLNGNEMGTGKTMESVFVIEVLNKIFEGKGFKTIVICPPTLRLTWLREIKSIDENADATVLYNSDDFNLSAITIMGYPTADKFSKELEDAKIPCVVIDEAHYCQAVSSYGKPSSKRAKAVMRLTGMASYVYLLTGTPKSNRNKNMFNILKMLNSDVANGIMAYFEYGKKFCDGYESSFGWNFNGNSNNAELNKILSEKMIRHLRSEVLPHLTKQRQAVPTRVNLKEYYKTLDEYEKEYRDTKGRTAVELALLTKARQVLARQKAKETIDFVKDKVEEGEKVVVVTCFTDVLNTIMEQFKGNAVKIMGEMTDAEKQDHIDRFQTGDEQVMVMNIMAGGVGVTLTRSHILVFNDVDFVPGHAMQAEDRICRGDQTECCLIYYMVADGADVDDMFVNMLSDKSASINETIDNGANDEIDFRALVEKSRNIRRV